MGEMIPDRGPVVRVVVGVVTGLSTVAVILRVITRGFILRRLGSDDYCLILGWVCIHSFSSMKTMGTRS